jgi:hypothetical protein
MEFEKTFELKEEHIKLLSNMYTDWDEGYSEFGSPVIDLKRPYGNSDVISDMYEILEGKPLNEDELEQQGISYDGFIKNLYPEYKKLHEETETALQIVLHTKSFKTGLYGLIGYGKAWVKI